MPALFYALSADLHTTFSGPLEMVTRASPGVFATRHVPWSLRSRQLARAQPGVSTRTVWVIGLPGLVQPAKCPAINASAKANDNRRTTHHPT
jgi:hypothetical protein